ncbi:type II secretion system F family protein [Micromonospora sp. NPDC049836]|uniref:type II secretion system F family protein n=1 Tax=Micromonospora sp. NPDC049836 TaxID=3364274 RepID=UPI0037ACC7E5
MTVLLIGAAAVVAWPVRTARTRRRAVLAPSYRPGTGRAAPLVRGGPPIVPRVPAGMSMLDRPPAGRPPNRRDPGHPAAALRLASGPGRSWTARDLAGASSPPGWTGAPAAGPAPAARSSAHPGDRMDRPAVSTRRDKPAGGLPRAPASAAGHGGAGWPATSAAAARWSVRDRVAALPTRPALLVVALLGGVIGTVLGGPVGGSVLAAYALLCARAVRRRHAGAAADRARRGELDRLCALAADLRAGLPVAFEPLDGPTRLASLGRAAVRLADRTGAPLAELLERVEADARATDRGLAAADAQAAGARATAWLLAALPLGGIGLGYAIGVDPVDVLLHSTLGGGSALTAVALQIGGLLWAERLGATSGRAA